MTAGFGALTPYRPLFVAVTASSLAYTHACYKDRRRTALAALLALALTSTPELVRHYNYGRATGHAGAPALRVQVAGMKCESCAARLKQAVQAHLQEPAAACSIDYAAGILTVHGSSIHGHELVSFIQTQGFQGRLLESLNMSAERQLPVMVPRTGTAR